VRQLSVKRIRLAALTGLCTFGLAACANQVSHTTLVLPLPPSIPVIPVQAEAQSLSAMPPVVVQAVRHPPLDLSGRSETGRASFYALRFAGRRTASGQRFNPHAAVAASKTLPLGTTAEVINQSNGAHATVTINDRGPNVSTLMLDVSPEVASQLGMTRRGVARVVVKPISIPEPDGTVKLGAGAANVSPERIQTAIRATRQIMEATANKVADR
jgi:rare lipoprotein A